MAYDAPDSDVKKRGQIVEVRGADTSIGGLPGHLNKIIGKFCGAGHSSAPPSTSSNRCRIRLENL
jgi:hypothetical protein